MSTSGIALFALLVYSVLMWFVKRIAAADSISQMKHMIVLDSIILMDIQMPVMDGYEATREIRSLPDKELANIPILEMTANAFKEDERAVLEAGMQAHIAKPVDVDLLLQTLASVLQMAEEKSK